MATRALSQGLMPEPAEPGTRELQAEMVTALVDRGTITSAEVETAFGAVPRHRFARGLGPTRAYLAEGAIAPHIGPDGVSVSSSSAPSIMAVTVRASRAGRLATSSRSAPEPATIPQS